MKAIRSIINNRPIVSFVIFYLIMMSSSRLMQLVWMSDRLDSMQDLIFIIFQGIRFDVVILSMLIALPVSMFPLVYIFKTCIKPYSIFLRIYFLLVMAITLFMECATPSFVMQYDLKPNFLFVEYLKYPKEVFGMLSKAYLLEFSLGILFTISAVIILNCLLKKGFKQQNQFSIFIGIPCSLLLMIVFFAGARSTLDHRPVNPSTVAFSNDPLMNTMALNSTYTVLYAIYEQLKYESGDKSPYGTMPEAQVLAKVYKAMNLDQSNFSNQEIPTLHLQKAHIESSRPKNIVIILEESLGAKYVGKLEGADITPNLDKLAEEGIWFEQLYATGTRSVRGIEAVTTGFLPTTKSSVVLLSGSQSGFFTIADLLLRKGYDTSFLYGGEAHFDNMRRFFSGNGFTKIIDEGDYDNPVFYGSWGASDEDLFNEAHKYFTSLTSANREQAQKPFFSLVFTSSNHSPFEFPDGRIELHETPKATVKNAIKYADFALGQFIEKAKTSTYWKDTVFLIVADHSDRVYGSELVPIEHFRIPGLFIGEGIKPQIITRLTSQIDLLPSLLSLAGVTAELPTVGINIFRDDLDEVPGRAVMQYGKNQAYLEQNQAIIFRPNLPALQFEYTNKHLILKDEINEVLHRKAMAHAILPEILYRDKSYRLPKK